MARNALKSKSLDLTGKFAYNYPMMKKTRLKLNLSQEQLSDELGLSVRTIRNAESGKPTSKIVDKIIQAWVKEVAYQEWVAGEGVQKG